MVSKKTSSSILGGSSLREKLKLARKELDELQENNIEDSKIDVNIKTTNEEHISYENKSLLKFFLSGRCDRKKHKYEQKAFYVLKDLDNEIKRLCSGGDIAVFNYLMHLGLNEIKKRHEHSFDQVSSIEELYKE